MRDAGSVLPQYVPYISGRQRLRAPLRAMRLALTAAFARDVEKEAQWHAFPKRERLTDAPDDLEVVVERIAALVLPVASEQIP